jgi:hypothetical protein
MPESHQQHNYAWASDAWHYQAGCLTISAAYENQRGHAVQIRFSREVRGTSRHIVGQRSGVWHESLAAAASRMAGSYDLLTMSLSATNALAA